MTQSYWPFDDADTTETQYSQLFRRLQSTGVWGDPSDDELKAYGDSSGLNVKLSPGYAIVRGHMYYNSSPVTVPVEIGSSNPRIDLLVLRLDITGNKIEPVIIKGTPSSNSPVPPTVTQTDNDVYEMIIGAIAVGASASTIIAGNVEDRRVFCAHLYGLWTTQTRPAVVRAGQPGYNASTGKHEFWDPATSGWRQFFVANSGTFGTSLVEAQNAAIARSLLGGTTIGQTMFTAASPDAVLTALNAGVPGKEALRSQTVVEIRTALRLFIGDGPNSPLADDIRFRDA